MIRTKTSWLSPLSLLKIKNKTSQNGSRVARKESGDDLFLILFATNHRLCHEVLQISDSFLIHFLIFYQSFFTSFLSLLSSSFPFPFLFLFLFISFISFLSFPFLSFPFLPFPLFLFSSFSSFPPFLF